MVLVANLLHDLGDSGVLAESFRDSPMPESVHRHIGAGDSARGGSTRLLTPEGPLAQPGSALA